MTILASPVAPYASGPVYTLSGTSGSPNIADDTSPSVGGAPANWEIRTNGTIWGDVSGTLTQFRDGIEWTDEQDSPTGTFYVNIDLISTTGTGSTGGDTNGWILFNTTRQWSGTNTNFAASTYRALYRVRISDQSDGSNVLADGYYECVSTKT